MKNKLWLFILLSSLIIYTSCSTTTGQIFDEKKSIFVTNQHIMTILPTDVFLEEMEIMQLIDGDYSGQKYLMQTIVILNQEEISVTAFSTLGNSIYDLLYRENVINYETIVDVSGSSAVYMIADIQLCYYPTEKVKEMVEQSGLQFEHKNNENGWVRSVMDDDKKIISIERDGKILEYRNLLRDYKYSIEEL